MLPASCMPSPESPTNRTTTVCIILLNIDFYYVFLVILSHTKRPFAPFRTKAFAKLLLFFDMCKSFDRKNDFFLLFCLFFTLLPAITTLGPELKILRYSIRLLHFSIKNHCLKLHFSMRFVCLKLHFSITLKYF